MSATLLSFSVLARSAPLPLPAQPVQRRCRTSQKLAVPGYEASQWYGIGAPNNTPAEIITKLSREINVGLDNPNLRKRLSDLGGSILPGSPADFGRLIAEETEKWGKVIRTANIKAE